MGIPKFNGNVSQGLLDRLTEFAASWIGLDFPPDRRSDLERGIAAVAEEQGFRDAEEFAFGLLSAAPSRETLELLANRLTVGETYFFREKKTLDAFEERILPELVRLRREGERRLTFWSAGCSTGEEPYTIAMLIRRLIPDFTSWNISIFATDINTQALQKAREAKYTQWSFRETPENSKESCFRPLSDGRLELLPEIRKMVTCSVLNLAADPYPSSAAGAGGIDVIFCRNVLMYFSQKAAQATAQRFFQHLAEGGWLVVSANEVSRQIFGEFERVEASGATLYRRTTASAGSVKKAPAAPLTNQNVAPPVNSGTRGQSRHILRPAGAKKKVQRAASDPPSVRPVEFEAALALYGHEQYDASEQALREILLADPGHAPAHALLARISANRGSLEDAAASCARAIGLDGLNAGYYYLLATVQQEQGMVKEALQSLRRAVYLDPDFVMAYFTLGNMALSMGNRADARRYMDSAVRLLERYDPEKPLPESEGITAGRLRQIIAEVGDGV